MFIVRECCPHCNYWYKASLLGLRSQLGPNQYVCRQCSQLFSSGCLEWQQMNTWLKLRYLFVSSIYVITLAIAGGVFLKQGYYYFQYGPKAPSVPLYDTKAWVYGLPFGVFAALFQYFRIVWSNQRRLSSTTEIFAYPLSWTTNLHLLVSLLLLTILLVGILLFGIKTLVINLVNS